MIKYLAVVALLLTACAAPPPAVLDFSLPRAAVHIVHIAGGNGSGVMIAPGIMLTAGHVASSPDGMTIDDDPLPVSVIRTNKAVDLALISVTTQCPCVSIATTSVIDESAIVVGFPLNGYVVAQILTEGRIQGIDKNRVVTSSPAAPGNSGGGVFVRRHDEWALAGILVQTANYCHGMICSPISHISVAMNSQALDDFIADKTQ